MRSFDHNFLHFQSSSNKQRLMKLDAIWLFPETPSQRRFDYLGLREGPVLPKKDAPSLSFPSESMYM